MIPLSHALLMRCRETLLECDYFENVTKLRNIFLRKELYSFRNEIPDAEDVTDRVEKTIAFLLNKGLYCEQLVFLTFLKILRDLEVREDGLSAKLGQRCLEVEYECLAWEIRTLDLVEDYTRMNMGGPRLQPEQVIKIAKQLLLCPTMSNKDQRERVLSYMPANMAQKSRRNTGHSDLKNSVAIVQACLCSPGYIEKLAYILYQFEKDSPQWLELDRLLREIFLKCMTYTRRQQLQLLLSKIKWSPAFLKKAYMASIPEGWLSKKSASVVSLDILAHMLDELEKTFHYGDISMPVLEFVERLRIYAQNQQELSICENLRAWVDERAYEHGLSPGQIDALRDRVQIDHYPAITYLTITVEIEDENIFGIHVWLLDPEGSPLQILGLEDGYKQVERQKMPDLLGDILDECDVSLPETVNDMIVEFFLPNDLLCDDFDQWYIDKNLLLKLGVEHHVVVRSFKRALEQSRKNAWRQRWKILEDALISESEMIDNNKLIWMCDLSQRSVYAHLRPSDIVCVAFTSVPSDKPLYMAKIFEEIFKAGVPIALWARKQTNHVKAVEAFVASLLPYKLTELPRLVWQERCKADYCDDEQHPGNHLTLLYDDPNRLPPILTVPQLKMPSARGGV